MDKEIVVSRYCEDLSWLDAFDKSMVTIYDKSGGGPRDRIHLPGWSSADGPNTAALWPGSIPLPNVGTESHTHMHHIVERWDDLAETTAFLSGDGPGHIPDLVYRVLRDLYGVNDYVPYGDPYVCDLDGAPNAPGLGVELRAACQIFFPDAGMFEWQAFHGFSMYLVSRDRIRRFTREQWIAGREWCNSKRRALAMERMYDRMFS